MTPLLRRPLLAGLATAGLVAGLAAPASAATFETVTSLRQAHAAACQTVSGDQTSVLFRHDARDVKRGMSRSHLAIISEEGGMGGSTRWIKAGARPATYRYTLPDGLTFERLKVTVEFKNGDTRSNRISRSDLRHC